MPKPSSPTRISFKDLTATEADIMAHFTRAKGVRVVKTQFEGGRYILTVGPRKNNPFNEQVFTQQFQTKLHALREETRIANAADDTIETWQERFPKKPAPRYADNIVTPATHDKHAARHRDDDRDPTGGGRGGGHL